MTSTPSHDGPRATTSASWAGRVRIKSSGARRRLLQNFNVAIWTAVTPTARPPAPNGDPGLPAGQPATGATAIAVAQPVVGVPTPVAVS